MLRYEQWLIMNENPKVTVLMPVYNGGMFIAQAIESILNQTYRDFEFIIIDDGSTDDSVCIINTYKDARIILLKNERNLGLPTSLNIGLDIAKGEYVARMDCDDISFPERFEKQVKYLDCHKEIGIVGTWMELFGDKRGIISKAPINFNEIKCSLLLFSSISHATIMFRRSLFNKYNLRYDPDYYACEDYELFSRVFKNINATSLSEILYKYRIHEMQTCNYDNARKNVYIKKLLKQIISIYGFIPTQNDIDIHYKSTRVDRGFTKNEIEDIENWYLRLVSANNELQIYPKSIMLKVLNTQWFNVCNSSTDHGLWVFNRLVMSKLNTSILILVKFNRYIKMLIKALLKFKKNSK